MTSKFQPFGTGALGLLLLPVAAGVILFLQSRGPRELSEWKQYEQLAQSIPAECRTAVDEVSTETVSPCLIESSPEVAALVEKGLENPRPYSFVPPAPLSKVADHGEEAPHYKKLPAFVALPLRSSLLESINEQQYRLAPDNVALELGSTRVVLTDQQEEAPLPQPVLVRKTVLLSQLPLIHSYYDDSYVIGQLEQTGWTDITYQSATLMQTAPGAPSTEDESLPVQVPQSSGEEVSKLSINEGWMNYALVKLYTANIHGEEWYVAVTYNPFQPASSGVTALKQSDVKKDAFIRGLVDGFDGEELYVAPEFQLAFLNYEEVRTEIESGVHLGIADNLTHLTGVGIMSGEATESYMPEANERMARVCQTARKDLLRDDLGSYCAQVVIDVSAP